MPGIIDLSPLDHEEKSFLGGILEFGDGLFGYVSKEAQCLLTGIRSHPLIGTNHPAGNGTDTQSVMSVVESVSLNRVHKVKAVLTGILEIVGSASGEKIKSLVGGQVACDLVNAVALSGMGIENTGSRVGHITQGDNTYSLPLSMEIITQGRIFHRAVLVGGDMPCPRHLTRSESAASGGRVTNEIVMGIIELKTHILHSKHRKVTAVGICPRQYLVQSHTVSDKEYDVLHLLGGTIVPISGSIDLYSLIQLHFLVLETLEITGGLVQFLGTGDTGLDGVASHPEVLVSPVRKEKGALGRIVCVEYIHSEPMKGEICCGSFGGVPEANRFPCRMSGLNGPCNGLHLRFDHPALAVPMTGELAEVGADHRNTGQLIRSVLKFPVREIPVKPQPRRPLVKVLRIRPVSGNDNPHTILRTEHIREFLRQGDHAGKRLPCLKINHKLKLITASLPHLSAIFTENLGYRLNIHCPKTPVRL